MASMHYNNNDVRLPLTIVHNGTSPNLTNTDKSLNITKKFLF